MNLIGSCVERQHRFRPVHIVEGVGVGVAHQLDYRPRKSISEIATSPADDRDVLGPAIPNDLLSVRIEQWSSRKAHPGFAASDMHGNVVDL